MAGLREIALSIAGVIRASPAPEPLPVTLKGETLEGGAELVFAIVSECLDAEIPLRRIEVDPALYRFILALPAQPAIPIAGNPELAGELRFFRR